MYDVIRQADRIGADHHHHHHHHDSSVTRMSYHPTSFRRFDPHNAYSRYGLYASDAVVGSSSRSDNGAMLPLVTNYSPVSPGSTWAEHMPVQHAKWSKPVIIDTRIQWDQRQRQYGCPMVADVSGMYRHGSEISNTVTPTVTGTSGLTAISRLSDSCSSPNLASFQRHQHCAASCAPSSVTCRDNDNDDEAMLQCGTPSSPHSATYQSNSTDATSNALFLFYIFIYKQFDACIRR